MTLSSSILNMVCAGAFLIYGIACLCTASMEKEFERFGLSAFRSTIGVTQILGGAALFAGFRVPWLGLLGAAGLCIQMFAGLLVRHRVGDGWQASLQALIFMILNLLLALVHLQRL